MDPQQTPNPAPYNPGQQPQAPQQPAQDPAFQATSMQDESQARAPAPQEADANNEVTVDFNQDAQNAGQPPMQPGGAFAPGAMPSLGGENPVADPQNPAYAAPQQTGGAYTSPDPTAAAGYGAPDPTAIDPISGKPLATAQAQNPGSPAFDNAGVAGVPNGPADSLQNTAQPAAFGPPAVVPEASQPTPQQSQPMQPQQPATPMFQADQQPPVVPATAPAPGIKADKKTVFILAGVAVVLIVAIAVLIFM